MAKIEENYSRLLDDQVKLLEIDPSADITELSELFQSVVVKEVEICKKVALEYMKDIPPPSVAPALLRTLMVMGRATALLNVKL